MIVWARDGMSCGYLGLHVREKIKLKLRPERRAEGFVSLDTGCERKESRG